MKDLVGYWCDLCFDRFGFGTVRNVPVVMACYAAALAIWALALVAAYPYLPGSSSEVFKGVSVLVGAMVTLGSSGVVTQLMSGLVLVYSRALRLGDHVVVGKDSDAVEGVVQEVGTLATKLKTMRNEEITIPNAVLVSNPLRGLAVAERLAAAGLVRLGFEGSIAGRFSPSEMLPACGQGALGLECREDDPEDRRSYRVSLTPRGHKDFAAMATAHEAWLGDDNASLARVLLRVLAVQPGADAGLAAVLPGALVSVARSRSGLVARPLASPVLRTPIGFLTSAGGRPTLALQAALAVAQRDDWRDLVTAHSGALDAADPFSG